MLYFWLFFPIYYVVSNSFSWYEPLFFMVILKPLPGRARGVTLRVLFFLFYFCRYHHWLNSFNTRGGGGGIRQMAALGFSVGALTKNLFTLPLNVPRSPRSSLVTSESELRSRLGHTGVDPRLRRRVAAKVSNQVGKWLHQWNVSNLRPSDWSAPAAYHHCEGTAGLNRSASCTWTSFLPRSPSSPSLACNQPPHTTSPSTPSTQWGKVATRTTTQCWLSPQGVSLQQSRHKSKHWQVC